MRRWLESLRSMPKGLKVFILYYLVGGTAVFLYGGLITPFARSLGLDPSVIGLYYTVYSLVSVAASFVGGLLGDRFGPKVVLATSRLLWALQALLFVITRDWRLFLLCAAVRGTVDIMSGPSMTMAGSLASDTNRATIYGVLAMVQSATGVLAPVLGGAVADRFGPRVAFAAAIPLLLTAAYLVSTVPVQESRAPSLRENRSTMMEALSGPNGRIAILMLLFIFSNGIHNSILNLVIPLFVQDRFGVAYTGISALSTASSLGTMATSILGGRLADKHGKGRTAAILVVLGAASLLPLAFTTTVSQIYLIFFFTCLFGNAAGPGLQALVVESVPEHARSSFAGLFYALFGVAYAAGSAVTGRLYSVNPMLPFSIFYANLVVSVLLILAIARISVKRAPVVVRAEPLAEPESGRS